MGGLEEGPDLDPAALPTLARGALDSRMYADTIRGDANNTFVTVLVDNSGSMGTATIKAQCPYHGYVNQKGDKCSRQHCGLPLTHHAGNPSTYAAVTALSVHDALKACRVEHAVLGYTSSSVYSASHGYSQHSCANRMLVFVEAPGLGQRADGISKITGRSQNLDGESLLAACRYAAERAPHCSRHIVIVIADGLPSGADGRNDCAHLTRCITRVTGAGFEVYGVGVGMYATSVAQFLQLYAPRPATATHAPVGGVCVGREGLTTSVMSKLSEMLIGQAGSARRG